MEREELEKLIEDAVMKGEMPCGLFDTGLQIVRVYLDGDGDDVRFEWFSRPEYVENYIDC